MDTLFDSYKNCYRKYATFRGRSGRQEYAVFTVANFLLSLVLSLIPILGLIFGLVIIIPGLAVSVRRLHDLNRSGWFILAPYLLLLIGFISLAASFSGAAADNKGMALIVLCLGFFSIFAMNIWMLFFKGTIGENRFGNEQHATLPIADTAIKTTADEVAFRLEQAKKMRDDGLVNDAEYEVMRNKIIKDI